MGTIIILATIGLGGVILGDSALSFLGFGMPPPYPSWGAMLSGSGRTYMYRASWMAIRPGVAISPAGSASTCWAMPFAMSWTRDCAAQEALLDALDSASAEG